MVASAVSGPPTFLRLYHFSAPQLLLAVDNHIALSALSKAKKGQSAHIQGSLELPEN